MAYDKHRHYKTLELDKILLRLSERAVCAGAKELALAIEPVSALSEVKGRCGMTSDAHMLLSRFGLPQIRALPGLLGAA